MVISSYAEKISPKKAFLTKLWPKMTSKNVQKLTLDQKKNVFKFFFQILNLKKNFFFLLQSTENWNLKKKFDYHLMNQKRLRDF